MMWKKFAGSLIEIKHLAWDIGRQYTERSPFTHPKLLSFIGIPLFSHLEAFQWLIPWPKAFFLCLLPGFSLIHPSVIWFLCLHIKLWAWTKSSSVQYPQHVTGDTLYSIDTYWWMKAINSKAMWENDLCLREKWGKSLSFKKYHLLKTQFCGILDSKDVENSCTKQGLLPLWRWLNVAACFWWVLRLWVSIEHRTALQVQKLTF